jgi:ATP-dependent Lon protease
MTRDTKSKLTTKNTKNEQNKFNKKNEDLKNKKKKNTNSDSDDDYISGSESDSENDELDVHEYRKFLAKIFPSKHIDSKIKAGEKIKNIENKKNTKKENDKKSHKKKQSYESDDEEWETEPSSEEEKPKRRRKKVESDSDYEEEEDEDDDDEDDDDYDDEDEDNEDEDEEDEEDEEEDDKVKNKKEKLNIILTIGDLNKDYDDYDEDDSYYSDYENSSYVTEDEDASISSDDTSEKSIKNNSKKGKKANKKETKKETKKVNKKEKETEEENKEEPKENETDDKSNENNILVLSKLKELYNSDKNNKVIQQCIKVCEENIKQSEIKKDKKEKKYKERNMRIFKKIIKDKNAMNDFSFYEKLDIEHQKKIIKELREINKITRIEKPYRITLLETNVPPLFKGAAMKKINSLRYMEPGSGEFYKIKNWVDTFMRIPFTNYDSLPLSIEDGVEKCHEFMENAQKILDEAVYGLNDAKMQIMQMLGQLLTNPKAIGTAIAIHGPPGTGKTSLVKEGISKILNRPFAFIALGGATDSSFLEGHGYTYEGSTWGKIVQTLIDSKSMNPVFYFDELDKISDTPRGEEIVGILTHLTDTSQNSQFHDKYFAEVNFDLSKCLFIFSYNDESKVNPILKDRMYRIKTKGYSGKEKNCISNNYLLPKIRDQVRFNDGDIIIPDDVVTHIIDTHCNKEDGVRNLKRCLEIIHTKLNLYRLMKPGSNLFEGEMALKVEFPFKVTKEVVDKLIKKESDGYCAIASMYL